MKYRVSKKGEEVLIMFALSIGGIVISFIIGLAWEYFVVFKETHWLITIIRGVGTTLVLSIFVAMLVIAFSEIFEIDPKYKNKEDGKKKVEEHKQPVTPSQSIEKDTT